MKLTTTVVIICAVLAINSLAEEKATEKYNWKAGETIPGKPVLIASSAYRMGIESFGSGVYYFQFPKDCKEDPRILGETLAEFKRTHPELEIVSLAPNFRGFSGPGIECTGYFVIFKKKD